MKIVRRLAPRMSLEAFADQHGLTMLVVERGRERIGSTSRFYAHFERADVKEMGLLRTVTGNGETEQAAIAAYAAAISGETLVIDAILPSRREIVVPLLLL